MQRTLILIKPDAIQRGLIGEIMSRFERAGLKVIGMKMVSPDEAHYHHHYEGISKMISRRGEDAFKRNLVSMQAGPVVALVLEGVEAVTIGRKIVGDTEPRTAAPGTIRGDYAHKTYDHANGKGGGLPNLVHASGNAEEAEQEVKHWFTAEELFEYKLAHQHLTQ
jgi:nucleoside-diphosphate kinase